MAGATHKMIGLFRNIFIAPKEKRDASESIVPEPGSSLIYTNSLGTAETARPAIVEGLARDTPELCSDAIDEIQEPMTAVYKYHSSNDHPDFSRGSLFRSDGDMAKELKKRSTHRLAISILRDRINDILQVHIQYCNENAWRFESDAIHRQASETPTEFHRFPELPAELRIKIWEMVSRRARVIAVEIRGVPDTRVTWRTPVLYDYPHTEDYPPYDRYSFYPRVCNNSQKPSLLAVNQESRVEGLKIYKLRSIDGGPFGRTFYFNPNADIIYFGGIFPCMRAIGTMINSEPGFPRYAIDMSKTLGGYVGVSAMRLIGTLHGEIIDEDDDMLPRTEYARGLSQVQFVVGLGLSDTDIGRIDDSVYLRPAMTESLESLEEDDMLLKNKLDVELRKVAKEQPVGLNYEKTAWVGKSKPEFGFAYLATFPSTEKVSIALEVTETQFEQLDRVRTSGLKKLENATGCEITIHVEPLHVDHLLDQCSIRKIVIEGPKTGVKKCREAIREVLHEISHGTSWFSLHFREADM